MAVMDGIRLPGDSTVQHVTIDVPEPGHGQVLLRMKASSICGSDIRAIYREHLGSGPEAYQGVIAGHEPCGQVVAVGPDCRQLQPGDRVVGYHIAGCGVCEECRSGYMIGCTSPLRAAHGWQRDGGHAEHLLAEEATCILLREPLTFVDGALVSCGFGTAYEGLLRLQLSGRDRLLITGLGPVGLAAAMLGRALGANPTIATDVAPERLQMAVSMGLVDHAVPADEHATATIRRLTGGRGCEAAGRTACLRDGLHPCARRLDVASVRPIAPQAHLARRRVGPRVPRRTTQQWQGQVEEVTAAQRSAYHPSCYLRPGNGRPGGRRVHPRVRRHLVLATTSPG